MISPVERERNQVQVKIPSDGRRLEGILNLPSRAHGVVLFAHGSGSGRFSPRNQFVAGVLEGTGLATLLMDLLDEEEADDQSAVFNIELLARRLWGAAVWVQQLAETRNLPLGYFGASTGAAAALAAAAEHPEPVKAVVSRGGRPDLALNWLLKVQAPTLLIVGGNDHGVIELNERALSLLPGIKEMVIVPGASHLFPEPGALEQVSRLAGKWFIDHLARNA